MLPQIPLHRHPLLLIRALTLVTLFASAIQAGAGPGSLDRSFDPTHGGAMMGPASSWGDVAAIARQPDGRLILGGQFAGYNQHLRRHVARVFPNGALDLSFNPGLGADGHVFALALQTNGQILVGGSFTVFDTQTCASLVRLNANGTLDRSFRPAINSSSMPGLVVALTVQPDGKILVGGSFTQVNGACRTNVARLNSDGTLDAGFVPESRAPDWYQGVVSLAVLPDGKVLVGGRFLGDRKLLCRLHPDGRLDTSFATDLTGYELIQMAVRTDGKIYAAGPFDLEAPGWYYSRLVLVNPDGKIDPTFSVDFANRGFYCFAALGIQPDDRLLVAGWFQSVNGMPRNQIASITPDGRLDETFDPGSTLGAWSLSSDARSMLIEPDGHVWLGGRVPLMNGSQTALLRLRPDGRLDQNFYDACGRLDVAGDAISLRALTRLPDGRLYVGGDFASYNGQPCTNLARVLPDGTLDRTFAPGWTTPFVVGLLALQPDGKLLAGGSSEVIRFNSDGTRDLAFEGDLYERLGMRLLCLALQDDGRILLGGEFAGGLARLNADGSLDHTFIPPNLPAYDGDAVQSLAVQPDRKILFGGNGAIGFQRLNPDGSPDPTFKFAGQPGFAIHKIRLEPRGILISGLLGFGDQIAGLARLHTDGSLDDSFRPVLGTVETFALASDNYILTAIRELPGDGATCIRRLDSTGNFDPAFRTPLGPSYRQSPAADMLVQPDGRVLLAGTFTAVEGIPVDGLARLNNELTAAGSFVRREITPSGEIRLVAVPSTQVSAYAVEDSPPPGWPVTTISDGGIFDQETGKVKFGPFFDQNPRILSYRVQPPVWGTHCSAGIFYFTGRASADGLTSRIAGDQCRVLAGYFPADTDPADLRLGIGEVTAYGAAWRSGSPWLCHPDAIPIDYVTRAGFLWRAGECYRIDLLITNEPLWWAPCDSQAPPFFYPEQQRSESFAQRVAPAFFIPGEPLTVTILASPRDKVTCYAIEDKIPEGWTAINMSPGGAYDPGTGKVKWGPYFDCATRELCYDLAPPRTAAGTAVVSGVVSFDGVSSAIAGRAELAESCRLKPLTPFLPGHLSFSFTGGVGGTVTIETSNDLISWNTWTNVPNTPENLSFVVPTNSEIPRQFFRATLAR